MARVYPKNSIWGGHGRAYDGGEHQGWCGDDAAVSEETEDESEDDSYSDPKHALTLYDDNRNGRISCAEARVHGIAPVYSTHPAYAYMTDGDGDGVVCELEGQGGQALAQDGAAFESIYPVAVL